MTPDELHGQNATVVGGARSGRAVARLLAQAGANVFLTEQGPPTQGLEQTLDEAGIRYEFGGHTRQALDADLFVLSPGVPSTINIVQQAHRGGVPIYSEIEVASWFCQAPMVAITGTNGKTTTTSLTGYVFRTAFAEDGARQVFVVGNIGYPFSDYVLDATPQDVVVLEVSSFQLDHVDVFRPRVSILLNVTPDHLNRYNYSFNAYAQSKFNIFRNQQDDDVVVYNHDDALVRDYVRVQARGRTLTAVGISLETPLDRGAFVQDETIYIRSNEQNEVLMQVDELALRGRHNLYNSLAAAVAARVMEVKSGVIRESLASFEGVPHRLETVRTHRGVLYVNDSKATNVNAVWFALESFERPIVLIAGGRDKGNDYASIRGLVHEKVHAVIGIGESAEKVVDELGAAAGTAQRVGTMEAAVQAAHALAQPGDVVLLSPACSSFDMFENYEERGDTFRRLVLSL